MKRKKEVEQRSASLNTGQSGGEESKMARSPNGMRSVVGGGCEESSRREAHVNAGADKVVS